ncbi:hypothetical protein F5148DRAFT_1198127 [Russula earlei]|uniref:Uncharacterized protein n=1 Tax=Russula earlei TaxID=71964 RepID=A0ACC0U9P0_9AGAM|nr:hypothetical protein F5148DRAFT_1198127 [Russula earlei]
MALAQPSSLNDQLLNLKQIQIGKYFFLGAYTMLLYDHLLTFPEEIQAVWKKKKTFPLYLFILVRYYALLAVSVVAFGYFSPGMTRSRCSHWMNFLPLGITIPLTFFPGILMLLRVYALYNRNKVILYSLSSSLLLQIAAGLWEYTVRGGRPAPLPLDNYEYHLCIYLPPRTIGHLSTLYVSWQLGYDTLVFFLTIARTVYMYRKHQVAMSSTCGKSGLLGNLLRDGAFYFGCIFSMHLMWVIMILHAPTGLRAIAAIPSSWSVDLTHPTMDPYCLRTVSTFSVNAVIVCRITLNLRTSVYGPAPFGRTSSSIPLSDLRNPLTLSGRSDQTLDPIGTKKFKVHIQTDCNRLRDYPNFIDFSDG